MADLKETAKQRLGDLDLDALKKSLNLGDLDLDKVRRALGSSKVDLAELHKREDEAAAKGFIGGFLLGLIVGAVMALIFAPKRGDETRSMVTQRAAQVMDKATGLVHQASDEGLDQRGQSTTEHVTGDAVDQSQSQFKRVTEDIQQ